MLTLEDALLTLEEEVSKEKLSVLVQEELMEEMVELVLLYKKLTMQRIIAQNFIHSQNMKEEKQDSKVLVVLVVIVLKRYQVSVMIWKKVHLVVQVEELFG